MNFIRTLLFVLLFGVTVTAATNTPPEYIPMTRDAAISDMLRRVAGVSVSVYAPSILYTSTTMSSFWTEYKHIGKPKINEITALMSSQELSFELARPATDYVSLWVYYSDVKGNTLFNGSTSFKLEQDPSTKQWFIPKGANSVVLEPSWQMPVVIKGITWARFDEYDANGNLIAQHEVSVNQNTDTLFFLQSLLDKRGTLYIGTYNDGKSEMFAYDAKSGEQIDGSFVGGRVQGEFSDVQMITSVGETIQANDMVSMYGVGQSHLLEVTILNEGWYNVVAKTTERELPIAVIVLSLEDGIEVQYDRPANAPPYTPVQLKAGTHHIRFLWKDFHSPNQDDGGTTTPGKG